MVSLAVINVEYPCQKGATGAGSHHNGFISIVLKFQRYDYDILGISDQLMTVCDQVDIHINNSIYVSLPAHQTCHHGRYKIIKVS